jgi:WD40 repeat protein
VDHSSSSSVNTNGGGKSRPQICNPPLIHSLTWSPSGESLAAGLGDGSIGIFSVQQHRQFVQTGLLSQDAHDSSVVSVVYTNFTVESADRVLCSAGSDGKLCFWDLGSRMVGSRWMDEWEDDDDNTIHSTKNDDHNNMGILFSIARKEETKAFGGGKPQKLFEICRGQKLNWVTQSTTSTSSNSCCMSKNDTIFVADTSEDITCYTIPMR